MTFFTLVTAACIIVSWRVVHTVNKYAPKRDRRKFVVVPRDQIRIGDIGQWRDEEIGVMEWTTCQCAVGDDPEIARIRADPIESVKEWIGEDPANRRFIRFEEQS